MVKKLREDNHNCWGDCEANAAQMEAAITEWNEAIKESGETTPGGPDATITGKYIGESKTLEEEFAVAGNTIRTNVVNLGIGPAMLNAPMVKGFAPADGSYLWVPNGQNNILTATDASAGRASLNFTVRAASANYRIWGLVNAPNTSDNGFYTNITTTASGVKEWEIPVTQGWEWRQLPLLTFNLPLGVHNLEIRQRKDGTKIKQVVITSDNTFREALAGDLTAMTLTYDLSAVLLVPGISFKVDVSEYDPYSYRFINPRIVTPVGVNVKAKNAKLMVNKHYNPQHSTFTLINKIATSTDGKISDYAMTVLKDLGISEDKISFTFEELKIVDDNGGVTDDPMVAKSEEAYKTTVYAVSRSRCISCHTVQNPPHAHDDYKEAHDIVVTQNLVNFTTPSGSRLVTKVQGRHNCGTQAQCDAIAAEFLQAITTWKANR